MGREPYQQAIWQQGYDAIGNLTAEDTQSLRDRFHRGIRRNRLRRHADGPGAGWQPIAVRRAGHPTTP